MNCYTYENMQKDINELKKSCPDIPIFSIGQSIKNRELYAIKLGTGSKRVFFNGAHHGMEWLTSKVLIEFSKAVIEKKTAINCSLYIVPMVNPDGVEIASSGKRWQANARGVDLNHNYDALWELSKKLEESYSIVSSGPTRFSGEFPESEPESKAIANFTRQNNFDMAICLHSQGKVIYYDFCGNIPVGTEEYLSAFESVSDFKRDIPCGIASYGGYKDWFIKNFKKPAFTLEIGLGENPLPLSAFDTVYKEVFPILAIAIQ